MFALAVKSFVKDIRNHVIYLLFLTLSISTVTLFSNIISMQSSYLFTMEFEVGTLYSLVSLIVIIMVIFLGFYAFQFYLSNQSKLLSIFRMGGSSFYKILGFMLFQLLIIFVIALFLGINLGFMFYRFINNYMLQLMNLSSIDIVFTSEAIIYIVIIVSIELIYLLLLTVGFVYRHQIKKLLGYQDEFDPIKGSSLSIINNKLKYRKYLFLVPIIYSVVCLLTKGRNAGILVGNLMIVGVVYPLFLSDGISDVIKMTKRKKKDTNIYLGLAHLDFDIRKTIRYLMVLSILLVVVCGMLISSYKVFNDFVYYVCVYFVLSLISMISIVYQLLLNIEDRKKDFIQLRKLGKTRKELKKIVNVELTGFYIVLYIITFLGPIATFISATLYQEVAISIIALLVAFYLGLVVISYVVTKIAYYNALRNIE